MKIAINTQHADGKLPKMDGTDEVRSKWRLFNGAFVNCDSPRSDIREHIVKNGHPFAGQHLGYRKREQFIGAQHLALDFDTEDEKSSLNVLVEHEFFKKYAWLIYTTPSHTDDKPRARVLFALDRYVKNGDSYEFMMGALTHRYEATGADANIKDRSRFFYGSKDAKYIELNNTLPLSALNELSILKDYDTYLQTAAMFKGEVTESSEDVMYYLTHKTRYDMLGAKDGEKYHTLRAGAYLAGGYVGAGLISEKDAYSLIMQSTTYRQDWNVTMSEIKRCVTSGINAGKNQPLTEIPSYVMLGRDLESLLGVTFNELIGKQNT